MATLRVPAVSKEDELISYDEALNSLTELERLKATVYAMNTLLLQKGVYSAEEFELQFRQSAKKQLRRRG